ncbi:hypothetical protein VTP01DRAFT_8000 [Rhizomucor pusillus]|uniref:uncharacterized protein n=1 Tax=Rhizomucor pusillus TaxID=4840 RepID=UPI0037430259
MDYVADEEAYALQTVSSHTDYLRTLASERNHEFVATHVDEPTDTDIRMKEAIPKRSYTTYTDQDKSGIHVRSAQRWALQYEKDPDSIFRKRKNSGRPRILNEEHTKLILECVDENPSIVLEQLMERLLQIFEGLKVSKTTLYRFVKNECNLTLKKARFQPVDRNSEAKTQERLDRGTVTGHYLSFLKATMDEMDKYEQMKGHYLVMDNAPIHKAEDIFKYIESREYLCAYLPSYSPELYPIEQFWSVVESKVKRNRFLESETLLTRISETSNSLRLSDFEGFVSHSYRCLDNCRNGEQL